MEIKGIDWANDANGACVELVKRLKAGGAVESRDFLRPIFKWLKMSSKHFDTDKAFSFLEWMTLLREHGDPSMGILPLPHLQPKYGYNTIVTMSQRNDSKATAVRAYECMLARNDEIDVFTYTSLLDVTGRNGHYDDSIAIYETMRAGKNQPNVVTFITLIRVLSGWNSGSHVTPGTDIGTGPRSAAADVARAKRTIMRLLEEANELALGVSGQVMSNAHCSTTGSAPPVFVSGTDGQLEVSVYNAALAGFVKMADFDYFVKVLQMVQCKGVALSGTSVDIICKFYQLHLASLGTFTDINSYGLFLVEKGALSCVTAGELEGNLNSYLERKRLSQSGNPVSSSSDGAYTLRTSCLGQNATTSMRESVITHDVGKLLERLSAEDCTQLHESDFVTLLHQCRKRKWSDQISSVLRCMHEVSVEGVPLRDVPPQPALAPSLLAYEAALAGYFCVAAVSEAWDLFVLVVALPEVWADVSFGPDINAEDDTYTSNALHFYRFVIKGFMRCGSAALASQAFALMQRANVSPTFALIKSLLRGYGCDPHLGVELLEQMVVSSDEAFLNSYALTSVEGFTYPKTSQHVGDSDLVAKGNRELLCTLFESVAVLGHPEKVEVVVDLCAESSCHALRGIMSGLLFSADASSQLDVSFIMTLLMAACSTNNITEACGHIHQWQMAGWLPKLVVVYSLALEALAGSVGGTSQRAVCDSMPSLPFRGFLRVGAVKKLHGNISIPAIQQLIQSQRGQLDSFSTVCHCDGKALADFCSTFADVDDGHWDGGVDSAGADMVMDAHMLMCQDSHASLPADTNGFKDYLMMYLQHVYARLLLVRSRPQQLKFHVHIEHSFSLLTSPTGVLRGVLAGVGEALHCLQVPSNFQAKVMSALLKSVPEEKGLPALTGVLTDLSSASVPLSCDTYTFPSLDLTKEMFKFVLSAKSLTDVTDKEALRQMMADVLVVYMTHKLSAALKIIQVVQHQKLFQLLDMEAFERHLVDAVLAATEEVPGDHLAALAAHVKNSDAGGGGGGGGKVRGDRREVVIRLARLLVTASSGEVAAALLCRFHVVDCDEFRSLLFPSEKLFGGGAVPVSSSISSVGDGGGGGGGGCDESGIDFETSVVELDGLPVLSLEGGGESDAPSVLVVGDLASLHVAEEVLGAVLQLAETCAEAPVESAEGKAAATCTSHVLALDCEWRPQGGGAQPSASGHVMTNKCSLLQVSCRSHVFLFDLMILERGWEDVGGGCGGCEDLWNRFSHLIARVFSSKHVRKLGFHLNGDIIRLRESFPASSHYWELEGVEEMAVLQRSEAGAGLAALCKDVLGLAMDKRMQCSDWQRRPLHPRQINYAALDAVVLLRIWFKTHTVHSCLLAS